ncbi:MAG: LysM peptidoglycan-binding domain-containing protein [bacterium]
MFKPKVFLVAVLMSGILTVGCATNKRIEGSEAPEAPPSPEVAAVPAPTMPPPPAAPAPTPMPIATPALQGIPPSKYIVVRGDTLWGISGRSSIYQDCFQWPLIFKANRDQIQDPDLIYPKQEFTIRHDYSDGEISKARSDAYATPKYVPHTKPRETLPINYF